MLSPAEIAEVNAGVDLRELAISLGAAFRGKSRYGACPICGGGKSAARFEIKSGSRWVCAVCNDGGDAIALVMRARGCDFAGAIAELGGRPSLSREDIARREAERARKRAEQEKAQAGFRERMRRELFALWRQAQPFLGTPGEAYLGARGVCWRLEDLRLRYLPELAYCDGETVDEAGRKRARVLWRGPVLLAPFVDADGRFLSLHRTWIDPARPGEKAAIADPETGELLPAKKMRGRKQGGRLDICRSGDRRRCVVGEGIETTLSMREALRDDSLYFAAGDLGNLAGGALASLAHPSERHANGHAKRVAGPDPDPASAAMPVPAECRDLLLLKDGDSDPFATDCAMRRAAGRHAAPGRIIRVAAARAGFDFNDMLRGAA